MLSFENSVDTCKIVSDQASWFGSHFLKSSRWTHIDNKIAQMGCWLKINDNKI